MFVLVYWVYTEDYRHLQNRGLSAFINRGLSAFIATLTLKTYTKCKLLTGIFPTEIKNFFCKIFDAIDKDIFSERRMHAHLRTSFVSWNEWLLHATHF